MAGSVIADLMAAIQCLQPSVQSLFEWLERDIERCFDIVPTEDGEDKFYLTFTGIIKSNADVAAPTVRPRQIGCYIDKVLLSSQSGDHSVKIVTRHSMYAYEQLTIVANDVTEKAPWISRPSYPIYMTGIKA